MAKSSLIWLLATFLPTTFSLVEAQQPRKLPRIAYLSGAAVANNPSPNDKAFLQGLRDLGYIDGKNIVLEYRTAEGKEERIPSLVDKLVQLKMDVFVSPNLTAIRAAKEATSTIPIVMITNVDPIATKLIDNLAHPGGNITGLTRLTRELSGKRLELLKEVIPKLSRVGVLWAAAGSENAFNEYQAAALSLKIKIQSLEVRGPNIDLDGAFREAVKERVSALIIVRDIVLTPNRKHIANLAIKNRTPTMCERSDYVEAGCLMSYLTNDAESFRRAATYVDKIIKGAKPADLPVEQAMKFDMIINLKTAGQIGLTIPQWTLMKADRVIR